MAIERHPALAASRADVRAAIAKEAQAKSAFRPSIDFSATESRGKVYRHIGQSRHADSEKSTRQYTLRLSQPLYKPSIVVELDKSRLMTLSKRFEQQRAYEKLTLDMLNVFFDILVADAQLRLYQHQRDAVTVQKRQARRSFDIGTVSITDVREAEAKLDTLTAKIKATQYELLAKQSQLAQWTGMRIMPSAYQTSLNQLPKLDASQQSRWVFLMEHNNPQILQAKRHHEIATLEHKQAKVSKRPTVSLNLSNHRNLGSQQQSTSTDLGWTLQAGVNVTVPVFDGGGTDAKIDEAAALVEKSRHEVTATRQQITHELNQTFFTTLAAVSNYHGFAAAKRSNETALAANKKGYEVGMRINADVLDAQSKLFEVRKEQLEAWYTAWRSYIKLRQLTGKLQSSDLQQLDTLLHTPKRAKSTGLATDDTSMGHDRLPFEAILHHVSRLDHDFGYHRVNQSVPADISTPEKNTYK